MYHPPGHKQVGNRPTTLAEAISFDQQRREAAYQEWLANKQRYQLNEAELQKKFDKS